MNFHNAPKLFFVLSETRPKFVGVKLLNHSVFLFKTAYELTYEHKTAYDLAWWHSGLSCHLQHWHLTRGLIRVPSCSTSYPAPH